MKMENIEIKKTDSKINKNYNSILMKLISNKALFMDLVSTKCIKPLTKIKMKLNSIVFILKQQFVEFCTNVNRSMCV